MESSGQTYPFVHVVVYACVCTGAWTVEVWQDPWCEVNEKSMASVGWVGVAIMKGNLVSRTLRVVAPSTAFATTVTPVNILTG